MVCRRHILLLETAQSALCVAETRSGNAGCCHADFAYYRYRKPEYTPEERQAMARRMHEHLSSAESVCVLQARGDATGAIYAVDVLKEAGKPWPRIKRLSRGSELRPTNQIQKLLTAEVAENSPRTQRDNS